MHKYKKISCVLLIIACLSFAFIASFPVSATGWNPLKDVKRLKEIKRKTEDTLELLTGSRNPPQWYVEYRKARIAAKKEDWETAIRLLKKAIELEPSAKKWRNKDGSTSGYYPHLYLGLAYLKSGDLESARQNCEESQEQSIAPKELVDTCLTSVTSRMENTQIAESDPTPIPSPTAPQKSDELPVIQVTSEIPTETDLETLQVAGITTDAQGVQEVNVTVQPLGKKGLMISSPIKRDQEKFHAEVRLDLGENEMTIEAINSAGQISKRTFTIVRTTSLQPDTREAGPVSPSDQEFISQVKQIRGEVYAVIIGIGDYQDERIPDLRFTVNDAQKLYDLLTDPEYGGISEDHVKLLLDQEATVQNIKKNVGKWLSRQAQEDDMVIIYYSGHGAPEEGDTYWVTYEADINDLYSTSLSNNDIHSMLDRVQSKRLVTFLDSCYSAATVNRKDRTRSVQTQIPWEKFSGEGRVTISASDGKQLSLELEEYQHGVFTYYLLQGLKGMADINQDDVIDVDEIWDYVKYQVSETARQAGNPQTPVLQGTLTAGIPLTFNMASLQEKQQQQSIQAKHEKLAELYEQQLIQAAHFECAVKMLDSGKTNRYLDDLLSDKLEPDMFNRFFECDAD